MQVTTQQYKQIASREMADQYTQQFLRVLPARLAERRKTAFADFADPQAALEAASAIRGRSLQDLPQLLEKFEQNALASGAQVFWAEDADQANSYIARIAREGGVSSVSKGKSMITEEMGLNEALQEEGISVWETDLGEFIAQLLQVPPFHIVGPAINIPPERISEIFLQKGVIDEPDHDPVRLGLAARRFLRRRFQRLEMGITGVNMAVAETGTLINVENEGNIRLCKSSPRIQVAVMSLEKVASSMGEALQLIRLLCRSGTGQRISAYTSMDTGPKKSAELDGPEELHIVILNNGRTRIYQDPLTREALRCIRCGACLNACPIYGKIGGYPYGWAYSGPMGQVISPLLLGLDRTRDLYQACTLCGKCRDMCPVGLDHPRLILSYRNRQAAGDPQFSGTGATWPDRAFYSAYTRISRHPGLWEMTGRMMRGYLKRRYRDNSASSGPQALHGWLQSRDLPDPPERSFRSQWEQIRESDSSGSKSGGEEKA